MTGFDCDSIDIRLTHSKNRGKYANTTCWAMHIVFILNIKHSLIANDKRAFSGMGVGVVIDKRQ